MNYPAVMEKSQDELLEINDQQSGVQEQGNEAELETEDGVIGAGELNTLMDIENIGDYLSMFGADLIRRLDKEYVPIHHPGRDEPLEILNHFKRPLFKSQAHLVTALIKGLRKSRNLFLIGEPGTGKTAMSIATFFALLSEVLHGRGRVIYMVPNHLIEKTKREVGLLLNKELFEVQFLNNYVDVIHLRDSKKMETAPTKIEVYIIARDTAKLGYVNTPAAKWVDRTYICIPKGGSEDKAITKTAFKGWVCPDCGGLLMKEEERDLVPMEYEDFFNKQGKPTRRKNNLYCSNLVSYVKATRHVEESQLDGSIKKRPIYEMGNRKCNASLWTAKNHDQSSYSGLAKKPVGPAPRKVSPANLFKRYFKNKFDLAIGDECHELTGGSAQAHAFHVLIGCAKKSIAMTGTLLNGYASNLFELIFRMFPQRLKQMGFNWGDVGKWIDLYGVRERVTKIRKDNALNSSSNGSPVRTSVKELPAAAPQLFTDMLSDVACFIQMSDMFEVLPELQEGPLNVKLGGERTFVSCTTRIHRKPGRTKRIVKKGIRLLAPSWYLEKNLNEVSDLLRKAVQKEIEAGGQPVLLGSLLNTLLSYPDVPFNFQGVYHPDTGEEIVSPRYRLSDRLLYPKELQLIKFARARIKAGRKVGVYATYTGKLGTLERLQTLFEERGIKTGVLESSVDGPLREAWIAEREQEGIQVMLTNPILVSTGLDLLNFPSLYFYQTGYRLSIVRQASRRHWRIGQQALCETVYSGYKGTMQELAINLMATKMVTALALEGQFSQDGLAALTESSGGSLANELAKRFVGNNIAGVESAESIWGKMSVTPTHLVPISPTAVITDLEVDNIIDKVPTTSTYFGTTLEDALVSWVHSIVPEDMHGRFEQQIIYVANNIDLGVDGITVSRTSFLEPYELHWDPTKVQLNDIDFRRWLLALTTKPVESNVMRENEWKLELLVEGKTPVSKRKKSYNVSEGQMVFNF